MVTLERLEQIFVHHMGFKSRCLAVDGQTITIVFFSGLTDERVISESILHEVQRLMHAEPSVRLTPEKLMSRIPLKEIMVTDELADISGKLLAGWTFMIFEQVSTGLLMNTASLPHRVVSKPEIEVEVFGPQVAFVEDLSTNVALIYQSLPDTKLHSETARLGAVAKTSVCMMYIEGIADPQTAKRVRARLDELGEADGVFDSSKLAQLLDDNAATLFPTLLHSERPDRVCKELLDGKIALLVDGSPFVIVCPITLYEFLHVPSDMNAHIVIGVMLRALRLIAMFFSIFGTSLYVAAISFHYQVLPPELLKTLIRSHAKVPFPPVFEAMLIEVVVVLLREAGIRLPTKVGQTMGIVGGIVIGQAAVEAGFVSNVLLMIVALGALASSTIPNFSMSNAQQVLRFPMIILAGCWGGIGVVLGISFLSVHLARQTSLGRPYLQPRSLFLSKNDEQSIISYLWNTIKRNSSTVRSDLPQRDFQE